VTGNVLHENSFDSAVYNTPLLCRKLLTMPFHLKDPKVPPFLIGSPNLSFITLSRKIGFVTNIRSPILINITVFFILS
jgi:hypothetical protein